MSILLRICYQEQHPETYHGVFVEDDRGGVDIIDTGDPVQDWRAAVERAAQLAADARRFIPEPVLLTSSCDHFVMDSQGVYAWAQDPVLGSVLVTRASAAGEHPQRGA